MDKKDLILVCISDTHTQHEQLELPAGDILIHAGDISLSGRGYEIENFAIWLDKQPFKYKIVIAGNHDITLDFDTYETCNKRRFHSNLKQAEDPVKIKNRLKQSCIYLENESTVVQGYKFYGSPYSLRYYDWGFQVDPGQESESMWSTIPADTDVVITHGPAYKRRDGVLEGKNIKNVGCPILLEHLSERIKPKYHIFGHIHEGYGLEIHHGTTFVNAASCNLQYNPKNTPLILTLPMKQL